MGCALDVGTLTELYPERARAKARVHLFQDCVWGAVGRLADQLRGERNRLTGPAGAITATDIAVYCQTRFDLKQHHTREFLNASTSGDVPWGQIVPVMLAFILCAKVEQKTIEKTVDGKSKLETIRTLSFEESKIPKPARDLIRFFLLNNPLQHQMDGDCPAYDVTEAKWDVPQRAWFFRPQVLPYPASTREVHREWEIWGKRLEAGEMFNLRMVRVGCVDHFRMMMLKGTAYKPSATGLELIKLMKRKPAGVEQLFVFPAGDLFSTAPRLSAVAFEQYVKDSHPECAHLIKILAVNVDAKPLNPLQERKRFAFELFNHQFRWVWYEWTDANQGNGQRLWVSRHPQHGPCLFDADDGEKCLFKEWLELVLEAKNEHSSGHHSAAERTRDWNDARGHARHNENPGRPTAQKKKNGQHEVRTPKSRR